VVHGHPCGGLFVDFAAPLPLLPSRTPSGPMASFRGLDVVAYNQTRVHSFELAEMEKGERHARSKT